MLHHICLNLLSLCITSKLTLKTLRIFWCMLLFKNAQFTFKCIRISTFHTTTFLSSINNAFIYVLLYEFKIIIKVFDLHIMIANWLQCFEFQHFISYKRNNMPWCKPLNHILYPYRFLIKFILINSHNVHNSNKC
jgi:hypothetical protein